MKKKNKTEILNLVKKKKKNVLRKRFLGPFQMNIYTDELAVELESSASQTLQARHVHFLLAPLLHTTAAPRHQCRKTARTLP